MPICLIYQTLVLYLYCKVNQINKNQTNKTMKKDNASIIIAVELFNNMVNSLESKLNSKSIKNEVKYHNEALNISLFSDFKQVIEVLQSIVDSYYFGYYEVSGFQQITLKNFAEPIRHNLSLINNAKKLIKFAK